MNIEAIMKMVDELYFCNGKGSEVERIKGEIRAVLGSMAAPVAALREAPKLKTAARLYTQNGYQRASVQNGPGKALTLQDEAQHVVNGLFMAAQANQRTIAELTLRIEQLLAALPSSPAAEQPDDAQILAWAERNHINRDLAELRLIVEDATTLGAVK